MDNKELGDLGERLACEYLVKKGFNILGKNFRINFGEIDIIARKKWKIYRVPFIATFLLQFSYFYYGFVKFFQRMRCICFKNFTSPRLKSENFITKIAMNATLSRFDNKIHFIEVKALKVSNPQSIYPEEHVNYKKQHKLKQLAQIWLVKNNYKQDCPHQIDVIGILIDEITRNAKLHYFPNVVEDSK